MMRARWLKIDWSGPLTDIRPRMAYYFDTESGLLPVTAILMSKDSPLPN